MTLNFHGIVSQQNLKSFPWYLMELQLSFCGIGLESVVEKWE